MYKCIYKIYSDYKLLEAPENGTWIHERVGSLSLAREWG